MLKSESTVEITKALNTVQKTLEPAKKSSENPFFKSKYASYESVLNSCIDLLNTNGIVVTQTMDVGDNHNLIVETTLLHTSGEYITSRLPMVLSKNDPQGIGSAITYARRYGLSSIIGLVEEDDDAEKATVREKPKTAKRTDTVSKPQEINMGNIAECLKILEKHNPKKWGNLVVYAQLMKKYNVEGVSVLGQIEKLEKEQQAEVIKIISAAMSTITKESKTEPA